MKLGQNLVNTLLVAVSLLTMTYLLLPIRQKASFYNHCVRESIKPFLREYKLDSDTLDAYLAAKARDCNG